jgi:hypothetical protein
VTDAELLAHLHNSKGWPTLGKAAAHRIEALIVERDEAWKRAGHAEEQWGRCEVKFSKAVQLLRKHCDTWAMNDFDAETLAELLGDKG